MFGHSSYICVRAKVGQKKKFLMRLEYILMGVMFRAQAKLQKQRDPSSKIA